MATITTAGSGDSNSTTPNAPWPSGTVPVVGDKVNIASGHTVTMVANHNWGDDTTTGVNVLAGGTLAWSRSSSSTLTCRGGFVNAGTVDMGTEASPIPTGVAAVLVANDSASMANAKYTVGSSGNCTWRMWGKTRTRETALTASALISDTSFAIADITGWEVGDFLVFTAPSNATTTGTVRAITAITPGVGTAGTVTVGAALSEASSAGRAVLNITSNVRITSQTPQTFNHAVFGLAVGATTNGLEIGHAEFVGGGNGATQPVVILSTSATAAVKKVLSPVVHNIVSVSGSTVTRCPAVSSPTALAISLGSAGVATAPVVFLSGISNVCALASGLADGIAYIEGPIAAEIGRLIGPGSSINYSLLSVSSPKIYGCSMLQGRGGGTQNGLRGEVDGGTFSGLGRLIDTSTTPLGSLVCTSTNFGSGSAGPANIADAVNPTSGVLLDALFDSCTFPTNFAIARNAAIGTLAPDSQVRLRNINNDPTSQQRLTYGGLQTRDNSVFYRSTSSVRFDCWFSGQPLIYSFRVPVPASGSIKMLGAMRYNASYGTGTPPTVTVSGPGLTTIVETCPTSGADTWFPYEIDATNPNAYPVEFTVTYTGQSTAGAAGAYCYFDGVPDAPWVDTARHFGYLYDLTAAAQTADPRITLSESAALALAVAVDHGAETITVTAALTNAEVFQACMADLCQTGNLDEAIHIESEDGEDFETTYTVILSGAGEIDGPYTDAAGRHVTVTAPNLLAGTRIQVWDVAGATELYNSTTALNLPITWTTDKTLRLRATKLGYLPLLALGSLTSAGLSFIDAQEVDAVYVANGIDGSTVTEFTADYPNVQVDIDDPDGVTTVSRLYAWLQYIQTTSQGIDDFFGAIEASDALNYTIDADVVDLKLDNVDAAPVVVAGGYLTRNDGATVIAATSGSIQMDPGRAYIPASTVVLADVTRVNGIDVQGSGTAADPWGP